MRTRDELVQMLGSVALAEGYRRRPLDALARKAVAPKLRAADAPGRSREPPTRSMEWMAAQQKDGGTMPSVAPGRMRRIKHRARQGRALALG